MIGIFDSGLGGLTVTKAIRRRLPAYRLLYLGDTARLPYGNRSAELLYQFTTEAVGYLFSQGCSLVIIACNSASAEALRRVQQEWLPIHAPDRRVLGVIRPVAEAVAASSRGRVGVIGTRRTVESGAYERELKQLRPDLKVVQQAAPLLVPLIEEGWHDRPETMRILRGYIRPFKLAAVDTLILGCTHYPLLASQFKRAVGKQIQIPDPAGIVAEKLADYLHRHPEIEERLAKDAAHRYEVTDLTPAFQRQAKTWLGEPVELSLVRLGGQSGRRVV